LDQLNLLPIELLSQERSDFLLATFLNTAVLHKNTELTRTLIDRFDVARIQTDPLPAVTQLCTNGHLTYTALKFVITCYPDKQPSDYFLDLINSTDDVVAVEAGRLLTRLFPEIDGSTWKYLYSLTEPFEGEPYHNPLLRAFFELEMARIRPTLNKPEYVRDFEAGPITEIPFPLPSVETAIDTILHNVEVDHLNFVTTEGKMVDIIDIKAPLIAQYAISTLDEKRALLNGAIPDFDETAIFREYGPVNCVYKHDYLSSDHECRKWGGCRMLLCNEFELRSEDLMAVEPEEVDWFINACSQCGIIIPARHYALREPLPSGGWRGCYCRDCLGTLLKGSKTEASFNRIQEQLMEIGIRDR
jgi:hypothetical protein